MVDTTPATLTLTDAATLINAGDVSTDPVVAEAIGYAVDGDVWQDGRAWVGPRPTGNAPGDALVNEEIRRGLAAANLARELTERSVAGVIGREPDWDLPDVADADQAALTQWWDRVGVVAVLRDALTLALCGERPVLRILVPAPPATRPPSIEDALSHIAVEVLGSDTARVIDDAAAALRLACAVFDAEARTLDGLLGKASERRVAEIVYLEGEATALRLQGDTMEEAPPALLRLGGRLTMHALDEVPPLLLPSILGLQRHLTLTMSAMGRNTTAAGFVERVMLNAQRPLDETGAPLPYRAGAGMINWLVGVPLEGGVADPSMYVREPSDPAAFTATADAIVFHAHKEARQLHALLAGDAAPSGESRRQAAADFLASLGPSARAMERAVRWLLETAYARALDLRGQAVPRTLRAVVTMTLSAGVASVEEIQETREGVGAKLLRRSRYQTAAGVDDPQAEDDAIDEERAANVATLPPAMQAQAAAPMTPQGADIEGDGIERGAVVAQDGGN